VVLLEGIEDPFNLGQMMRTIYVAGFDGVILSERDWSHVETTLLKSSAGAFERLMMVKMDDKLLPSLKQAGFTLAITDRSDNACSYQNYHYPTPLILAIGGERRGLSKSVIQAADVALRIDYPSHVKLALSAVSACALLVFEAQRQSIHV
jgi:23S rRNA (guanosine2251-2'-O)-methyltransferase